MLHRMKVASVNAIIIVKVAVKEIVITNVAAKVVVAIMDAAIIVVTTVHRVMDNHGMAKGMAKGMDCRVILKEKVSHATVAAMVSAMTTVTKASVTKTATAIIVISTAIISSRIKRSHMFHQACLSSIPRLRNHQVNQNLITPNQNKRKQAGGSV